MQRVVKIGITMIITMSFYGINIYWFSQIPPDIDIVFGDMGQPDLGDQIKDLAVFILSVGLLLLAAFTQSDRIRFYLIVIFLTPCCSALILLFLAFIGMPPSRIMNAAGFFLVLKGWGLPIFGLLLLHLNKEEKCNC